MTQFENLGDCTGIPCPGPSPSLASSVDAIRASLTYLDLGFEEYFVNGSANLVLRGIRHHAPDLDLVVNDETFEWMSEHADASFHPPATSSSDRGRNNTTVWLINERTPIPVSATTSLPDGEYPISFESHKDKVDIVSEIPLLDLDEIVAIKKHLGRERDKRDLKLIDRPVSRYVYNPQSRRIARSTSEVKANAERTRSLIQDRF